MSKNKFYHIQEEVGLNNSDCAQYLGVTKRSIERWRTDKHQAPKAVILALQALRKVKHELQSDNKVLQKTSN